jgi:hypothetical protein
MRSTNNLSNPQSEVREREINRFNTLVLGVVFVLFPVLLYLPGSIYLANTGQFSLRPGDLALIFLPAFLFSAVIGVGLISIFPKATRRHLVALTFALGLLFWLQGSIFVWQYGVFDGRDIQWDEHGANGLIDSPLWLLLIVFSLSMPAVFIRLCRPAAVVIIGIQTTLLLYGASVDLSKPDDPTVRNFSIDTSQKYAFSENINVILIVLDAFQSDVFLEIVSDGPEYEAPLEGFTYFRDAVAGSNYTELAIPALLTGEVYDNSIPREQFVQEAYLRHSIMIQLMRHGFVVDIYPWLGWGNESIYFDERIASNLTRIESSAATEPTFSEKKAKEALHLLDLSLFRVAPHYLKPGVYNDKKWLMTYIASFLVPEGVKHVVSTDNLFTIGAMVDRMPAQLSTKRGEKAFKYYHLAGVHSPLSVNEDLQFSNTTIPFSREHYVRQAKANLRYLADFFAKLKAAGIYDKSLILVVGDHGSGESPEMYIERPGASREPFRLNGTKRNFRRDKARAIPLVLIKPIRSQGSFKISEVPVALASIPATILSELGFGIGLDQKSMFRTEESDDFLRYHSAFGFNPNQSEYVDDITVYEIDGDSWLNESWTVHEIRRPGYLP